ncbi:MAG: molybdate ABC transporter permease subunit [Deltaproteobacteria bacterium]|nr:molybdate ABC transporter permease subunit [Deltaproteobacteria bacterium]
MDYSPLLLSLETAVIAMVIAGVIGVGIAIVLANFRFPGRDLIDVVTTWPLVMPPTVLGYYLLVVVGTRSPIGRAFDAVTGSSIVFTFHGVVLAAVVGSLPLVVKTTRTALEEIDPTLVVAARTLGATRLRAILSVQLPLAYRGVVAALMLAFAKSTGDFGITLMVAGNIPGKTRTAALAIFDDLQAQRNDEAFTLAAIVTIVVSALLYVVAKLTAREHAR